MCNIIMDKQGRDIQVHDEIEFVWCPGDPKNHIWKIGDRGGNP